MADKRYKNILSEPPLALPELKGLGEMLFEHMSKYQHKTAITDAKAGKTETYKSILQNTIRTSLAMRSKGIKPNDIITICSNTTIENFLPFYASFFIGAISANIDAKSSPSSIKDSLKVVYPKMIFTISKLADTIESVVEELKMDTQIVVFEETKKHLQFSEFLLPHPEESKFIPYKVTNIKHTAVIAFTSGSTGPPKGVCISHFGVTSVIHQTKYRSLLYSSVMLSYTKLSWITGVTLSIECISHGCNHVVCSDLSTPEIWDAIRIYKATSLFSSTFHLLEMCKHGRPEDADTSTLRFILYGGHPTTKQQHIHIKNCFPDTIAFNAIGQTEASGCTLTFDPTSEKDVKLNQKSPDSVGTPVPGYSYKIVDIDTEEILGPNQEGELRIKSDFMMNGYYKRDSSSDWDTDGFLKTGDVAYYDEDKCFFILGRIKELLKYQTIHISATKIELVLLKHPAVHSCLVIGKPHEIDGDHLMGVVVLKDSALGTITEKELQQYVDDQVEDHQKLRAGVKFIRELPLTVTNKINRRLTRKYVIEGKI